MAKTSAHQHHSRNAGFAAVAIGDTEDITGAAHKGRTKTTAAKTK